MKLIKPICPKCGKPIGCVEGEWICFTPHWECGINQDPAWIHTAAGYQLREGLWQRSKPTWTVSEGERSGEIKFTEFRGGVFLSPLSQVADPDNPQYTGLQFTRQGADGFTLSQLRDMLVREGWLIQSSASKVIK